MHCETISKNIADLKEQLGNHCKLIVVSKYRGLEEIQCAYDAEHRIFAENRVQALIERKEALPDDIEWHLIGHLQKNKVKYIAPFIAMIHSVDSAALLEEINKQAKKNQRVIPCLLQLHIAQEETKFGLSIDELNALITKDLTQLYPNVIINGLMAMASNTTNTQQIKDEFNQVQHIFKNIKDNMTANLPYFNELSIGMSSDYLIAKNTGSTMVRIGSKIFEG